MPGKDLAAEFITNQFLPQACILDRRFSGNRTRKRLIGVRQFMPEQSGQAVIHKGGDKGFGPSAVRGQGRPKAINFRIRPSAVRVLKRIADRLGICPPESLIWKIDRKSTRLNSSHANISYAVFCLKKK